MTVTVHTGDGPVAEGREMTAEPLRKRDSSLWRRDPHDWYVEPAWCSLRLFEEETFCGTVHDPACGGGNIVRSALAHGHLVTGGDIVDRSEATGHGRPEIADWLAPTDRRHANIVSNPPFGLCDDRKSRSHPFVERCLERAERKVALLLPANWVQGDMRSRWLERTPLRRVWFLSPSPSMPPGHVLASGAKPGNGTTDYAWFVWQMDYDGATEVRWLRRTP